MTTPAPRRRRSLSPATKARRGLLPPHLVITVNVSGSVTSERDLVSAIQEGLKGRRLS